MTFFIGYIAVILLATRGGCETVTAAVFGFPILAIVVYLLAIAAAAFTVSL